MRPTEVRGEIQSAKRFRNTSEVRIVLVDDRELLRAGIRSLISASNGFRVVGEAKDKAQGIARIRDEQPDVILLNMDLKSGDGVEIVPELLAACETSRLAVLTDSDDPAIHRRAILLGARGIISKQEPAALLTKAISRVHAGGVWFDRALTASLIGELLPGKRLRASPEQRKMATLTEREREVIRLVGRGLRNKQIAERLFISEVTVHHHLTSIYSKLGLNDRLELVIYAFRNGLAELPTRQACSDEFPTKEPEELRQE